jgi:uncharacterized protein (DUF1810 family)
MRSENNLNRFLDAQEKDYSRALAEIKNWEKAKPLDVVYFSTNCRLGYSEMATFYAIKDIHEASDYLAHPVLGSRLIDISTALLGHDGKTANQIMGSPDDLKLRSCMTLFSLLKDTDPIFQAVLDKFFNGAQDQKTLSIIKGND